MKYLFLNIARIYSSYGHSALRITFLCLACYIYCHPTALAQTVPRYTSLSKHFDTDLWLPQFERKLDTNGVVVQKKAYHPLSIAFYGIMNYEDYLTSKDSVAWRHVHDQFRYF